MVNGARGKTPGRSQASLRGRGTGQNSRFSFNDVADEGVSVLGNSLDIARAQGIVTELFANVLNALSQRGVGDEYAVPHFVEQSLFLD